MDVDLDCPEAKGLAELILPKPFAQFDRGTSDSGHLNELHSLIAPLNACSSSW
jgi:hypothetical protein